MNQERDNLKAGLFVSVGVLLTVVVIFVLADFGRYFEQKRKIQVFFQLSDGLQGLKEGAPVTLGDQLIGDVVTIRDKVEVGEDRSMRVVGKVVTAQLPTRYDLYQNAVFELKSPLIGSGTSLNIRSVGEGQLYTGDVPIAGSLAGNAQVQELVREAGIQEQQRQQIRNVIANIESITDTLRQDVPTLVKTLKQILADGRAGIDDLSQAAADVGQVAAAMRQRHAAWLDRFDQITISADQSLATVRDLIQDKDSQLRLTVENLYGVTQVAKDKTMVQVTEALDKAIGAVDHLAAMASELSVLVAGQRPVLERALANAQLASDQLKLTAIEVRRSPWRLLYDPDEEELDTDNLYDAARSFALAAGVLDTTAQSLRAVVDGKSADDQQIRKILDHLEAVFLKFEDTEAAFWNAINVKPPAP